MNLYRYVPRDGGDVRPMDVALTDGMQKSELDERMAGLGYAFERVIEQPAAPAAPEDGNGSEDKAATEADVLTVAVPALPAAEVVRRAKHKLLAIVSAYAKESKAAPLAVMLVTLVVQFTVFRHALRGDDLLHLVTYIERGFWASLLVPYAGAHVMPVHRIIYAAFQEWFGIYAVPYFVVALGTHVGAAYLVYRLILRLTDHRLWSAFWATVWGITLIGQSVMCSFACYGNICAALFALWVVEDVLRVSDTGEPPTTRTYLLWLGVMFLCANSFGAGMAAVAALPVFGAIASWRNRPIAAGLRLVPIFLFILAWYMWVRTLHPEGFSMAYENWVPLLAPIVFGGLITYIFAGMFFPAYFSFTWGRPYAGPLTEASKATILAVAVAIGLACIAAMIASARASKQQAHRWLAVLVIPAASYAAITVGRMVVTLNLGGDLYMLIFATRYQYFASAFMMAGFAGALFRLPITARFLQSSRAVSYALVGWFVISFVPALTWAQRVEVDDSEYFRKGWRFLDERVEAAAASQAGKTVLVFNEPFPPMQGGMAPPPQDFPHLAAAWAVSNRTTTADGRTVRFVERDPELLATIRKNPKSRIAPLMVSRAEAGAGFHLDNVIDVADLAEESQLVSGFNDRDNEPFRWTRQRFAVEFAVPEAGAERGALLEIKGFIPQMEIDELRDLRLKGKAVDSVLPEQLLSSAGPLALEIPVPAQALQKPRVIVDFELDKRFVVSGDPREFGIVVSRFELRAR
jgi:hypothetical protein